MTAEFGNMHASVERHIVDTPLLVCIRKPGRNRGWPRLHFYSARMLVQEYRQMTAEFGNMHAPKCDAMIHRTGLLCAAIGDVKPCLFSIRTAACRSEAHV